MRFTTRSFLSAGFTAAVLVALVFSSPTLAREASVDVCVYGGTAGGVVAAIASKQEGKSVLLVEPGRHLGGMTSGGLGWTDFGNKNAIGGLSLAFYRRVGKAYGRDEPAWTFEPSVAERVLCDWVNETGVEVLFEHRITGADKRGTGVASITLEHAPPQPNGAPAPAAKAGSEPVTVQAKVFIDCTYEGDLMAAAGVEYTFGRESSQKYGESLNGIRAQTPQHQFRAPVDPYVKPGDPSSGLLPLIQEGDGGTPGDGDHRVQAYNFRLCFTNNPANRLPINAPEGYDPARYELLARHVESMQKAGIKFDLGHLLKFDMVTPEKTDINNQGAVSTDYIGANWAYPEADYATRAKIWEDHLRYVQGITYFLGNSERVPAHVREAMQRWGPCKDEFTDTAGWPHQMYIREARRMVGPYVVTQHDCEHRTTIDDPVGLGAYNMDSHNCQRIVQNGVARNEGDVQVAPAGPYAIPYRAITPKAADCTNVLVPVAFSASHIAYGSARMEPVFMVLGHSAALAACQSIDENVSVQAIDYPKLRARLLKSGQILEPPPRAGAVKLPGIVVDDADGAAVQVEGPWQRSSAIEGFVGAGYLHDANAEKGRCTIRFTIPVKQPGLYDVRFVYTSHANRATNVPVKVTVGGATFGTSLNQRRPPPIDGKVASIGEFRVRNAAPIVVEVSNAGTDGHVVVDAIQAVVPPEK